MNGVLNDERKQYEILKQKFENEKQTSVKKEKREKTKTTRDEIF